MIKLKKRQLYIIFFLIMFFFMGARYVNAEVEQIYLVPIEGEVGPAMASFVSESIEEAEINNASAIIFNIDTPGGQIDSSIKISNSILETPIKTIAYISDEAISAGTIISISAEKIYMSSSSTIGAAETRPNEEKYISYWTGKLRNVAQIRNRDSNLVASMADANIEIEGVIDKDKLLTLTSKEAKELEFIDGIKDSIEEVQKAEDLSSNTIYELSPSFQLRLASMSTSVTATSILLTLGFVGAFIEIITPGFGFGGGISLTAFGLYFTGVLLAGLSNWVVIAIFIIGIMLLILEVIVPGFGVPGVLGIIAIMASIVMASTSIEQALTSIIITAILIVIVILLLLKFLPKNNKFFDRITLSTSLDTSSGYVSSKDYDSYKGRLGVTITPLRPAGSIEVDSKRLDVVSEGVYIEKNQNVRIVKVEGNRIIVRKAD